MRLVSAEEISPLLPLSSAIPLMRDAFRMISSRQACLAERQALELDAGTGLLMGAAHESHGIVAKLVTVVPSNLQKGLPGSIGLLLLMDSASGEPLALMDGTHLTAIRTAALNACAIDLLARKDATIALLVGCGTQACAQLDGLVEVRDLEQIRVLGRDRQRAEDFVNNHRHKLKAELRLEHDARAALEGVDIIIGATNSDLPVVPGDLIPAGCHVSGIGSFKESMCEFDSEMLSKSSIFVESRLTAEIEAGELMVAMKQGITSSDQWTELGEVLSAARPGRQSDSEITFFKSVGHAVFDLFAARAVWQAALEQDAGEEWQP